jgi:hypothetical protein
VRTGDHLDRSCFISAHNTTALPFDSLNQIASAIVANLSSSRVPGTTEWAVDIRSCFSLSNFLLISDYFLPFCLFEFHIIRLWGTAIPTMLIGSWINPITIRASPLQFNISNLLARH